MRLPGQSRIRRGKEDHIRHPVCRKISRQRGTDRMLLGGAGDANRVEQHCRISLLFCLGGQFTSIIHSLESE